MITCRRTTTSFVAVVASLVLASPFTNLIALGRQEDHDPPDSASHLRQRTTSLEHRSLASSSSVISMLDVNRWFEDKNTKSPYFVETVTVVDPTINGEVNPMQPSLPTTTELVTIDDPSNTGILSPLPEVSDTSTGILSPLPEVSSTDEATAAASAASSTFPYHDPVLSTLAEQRPCGIVPAMVKTVSPTWLASYPESGSQETWRLVQAITGLMTDEDVTNHGHALAGKAVLIKTHFPSHTPAAAFEPFQSQLLIHKAILVIRNPIYAIPALHKFTFWEEQSLRNSKRSSSKASNHDDKKPRRVPIDKWIQWRNENFELELRRWVDQIRWWVVHYYQDASSNQKLLLIPYERLISRNADTGVDELWKLAFFLRSVDRSIADSMIPLENFQCIWEFVVGPIATHEEGPEESGAKVDSTTFPGPFTSGQLELILKAVQELRDEYMHSCHELASVMQQYLVDVNRLQRRISDATASS